MEPLWVEAEHREGKDIETGRGQCLCVTAWAGRSNSHAIGIGLCTSRRYVLLCIMLSHRDPGDVYFSSQGGLFLLLHLLCIPWLIHKRINGGGASVAAEKPLRKLRFYHGREKMMASTGEGEETEVM